MKKKVLIKLSLFSYGFRTRFNYKRDYQKLMSKNRYQDFNVFLTMENVTKFGI